MRPSPLASLLVLAAAGLGACAPAASGVASPSATPIATAAATPAGTPAATPAFTTGPSGTPIGSWSLTLVNGPTPGSWQGTDEMICVGAAGVPISVAFQPANAPPIQQIDAGAFGQEADILVSAGGIESSAIYQAETGQLFQTATVMEANIDAAGIVHLTVEGTQQFPGESAVREISLTATCPLFPAETDG